MTAGYDPSNPAVPGAPGASGVPGPLDQPRHAADDGGSERLGPLPPRMNPTGSFPKIGTTGPIPAVPVTSAPPPPPPPPPPPVGFPSGGFPIQPVSPYATGPLPVPGPVSGPGGRPYSGPPGTFPPPRRSRLATVALI